MRNAMYEHVNAATQFVPIAMKPPQPHTILQIKTLQQIYSERLDHGKGIVIKANGRPKWVANAAFHQRLKAYAHYYNTITKSIDKRNYAKRLYIEFMSDFVFYEESKQHNNKDQRQRQRLFQENE